MPTYRDDALVLRAHLLGEADKILTLLCKNNGKVRAVAKGVRKTTSRFGARLEAFNVVDAQFYEGKSLDIVQQAETIGGYSSAIGGDYSKYTAAMVMVETADSLSYHANVNCVVSRYLSACTESPHFVEEGSSR